MLHIPHRHALPQVHSVFIFEGDEVANRAKPQLPERHCFCLGFDRLHFRTAMWTSCQHMGHLAYSMLLEGKALRGER